MYKSFKEKDVKEFVDIRGLAKHLLDLAPHGTSTLIKGREDFALLADNFTQELELQLVFEILKEAGKRSKKDGHTPNTR